MKRSVHFVLKFLLITFCTAEANERVFLTNLIEDGKIDEAKQRARVAHPEIKNVESYAGYITVNQKYNSNTFFWYFPSKRNPQNDPVMLWMNGGPGVSSLFGLFNEHGPFVITENQTVEMRKYSWHVNHNIIYIDNPVGAGYSFTDNDRGYVRTEDDVGRDVLAALVQFFQLFPELKKNDFYVAGESYAGKYVPAVSMAIRHYNAKAHSNINIKGLSIGNGWVDPINQLVYSDLMYKLGLLDQHERNQFKKVEDKARYYIERKEYAKASVEINSLQNALYPSRPSLMYNFTGFDFPYNFLLVHEPVEWHYYTKWVERSDVRKALHVGNTEYNDTSQVVAKYLLEDMSISHASYVEELLEDYKVLIYNGNLDLGIPWISTENYIRHLNWSGAEEYNHAVKKKWMIRDDLAGYIKVVSNLTEVLVRNAGHLVPNDQPLWAWELITRFTH